MTDKKARIEELLKDQYVIQWQAGLSQVSKGNYIKPFEKWVIFTGLSPTQQIEKRINDLTSKDLSERHFFEQKFREYKAFMESEGKINSQSIKTYLIPVASFFGRTVGRLDLKRGDWNSTLSTRIKNKLTLEKKDIKAMYAHGSLRDRCLLLVLSQSGFSEVDVSEFHIEDMKGFYESPISVHYFLEKQREKTGETQATCLSFEAMHDLRDMLAERGNPKEGYLFVSQTKGKEQGEGIEVRRIHEAMSNLAEKALEPEKAKGFKTKMLRSFYNSGLLHAELMQEVKDLMMGHQRLGARGHYGYDAQTIIEAYTKAFDKSFSINGMQSREDLAKIKADLNALIGAQQVQIEAQKKDREADHARIAKLEDCIRANTTIDPSTISKMVGSLENITSALVNIQKEQQEQKKRLDALEEIETQRPEKVKLT